MAGYSKKSLVKKLGIKAHSRLGIIKAPRGYLKLLKNMPRGVRVTQRLSGTFEMIHFFAASRAQLSRTFGGLKKALLKDGTLWISWPKGSSGKKTDLNESAVMKTGLRFGLVDVKVAAIDDTWSGLKFVYRLRDR